jgi:hypothetical protein
MVLSVIRGFDILGILAIKDLGEILGFLIIWIEISRVLI